MNFTEPVFALFFLVVVCGFWALPKRRLQHWWLLCASYIFYGWWDPRFLGLIVFSSVVDYFCGAAIYRARSPRARSLLLSVSLTANLGLLGVFKYADFVTDGIRGAARLLGHSWSIPEVDLFLPIGISFYTFQTLSYTIDVYRGEIRPTRDPVGFFFFVAAFPQLVAGPIVRARELLPQLTSDLREKVRIDGIVLVVYGLVKKVCLADQLALHIVDPVFGDSSAWSASAHILATWAFAFQIFLDFSAYTDIARGTGRLLGLELPINFRSPYLAQSPSELWERAHISLSRWLRDYLYISLGGNRKGKKRTYMNLGLTMLLGGLWHGAAWQFLIWGALHGLYLIVYSILPTPGTFGPMQRRLRIFVFFNLTCFAWIFFRAEGLGAALDFLAHTAAIGDGLRALGTSAFVMLAIGLFLHNIIEPRLEGICRYLAGAGPLWIPVTVVLGLTLTSFFGYQQLQDQAFIYFQF